MSTNNRALTVNSNGIFFYFDLSDMGYKRGPAALHPPQHPLLSGCGPAAAALRPLLLLLLAAASTLPSLCSGASYGPSFLSEPPAQVLYSNNSGLVLDCIARGEPTPIIDWVDDDGNVLPLMPSVARYVDFLTILKYMKER